MFLKVTKNESARQIITEKMNTISLQMHISKKLKNRVRKQSKMIISETLYKNYQENLKIITGINEPIFYEIF
jgi:hypothetical protein